MKKICVVLMLSLLPVGLFAAGRGAAAEEGYLRFAWWGNPARDERTMQVIDMFEAQNPGVTIEPEPTAWGGFWERMNTLVAAGNMVDIMQQDVSWIGQFFDRNLLLDMQPFVGRGIIDLSQWDEGGLSPGRIDGQLVGLLLGTNALALGFDAAVLRQAGVTIDDANWTWADYERIVREVFARTGRHAMPFVNFRQVTQNMTRQLGGNLFTADGRYMGIAHNAQARAALLQFLEMQMRLANDGILWNPAEALMDGPIPERPLNQARTVDDTFWSNQFVAFQNASQPRELVMKMPPRVPGGQPTGMFFRPSMYISIPRASTDPELSARFINFFINDIEANRILLAERGVPIPNHIRADLLARVDANNRVIFSYIDRIGPFAGPADPLYPANAREAELAVNALYLQMLLGQITPAVALDRMVSESSAILQRP
ncbi:MAG: extracellular solute-binding protein [Treponema sp.]|nr:extracellular solute-binding protein [Treponema sp.]